jgi:hypothetical protein
MFQAVLHRYRELHGEDAPPAWVAALRSDYRGDAAWKATVAQKKRERAAREAGEERAA